MIYQPAHLWHLLLNRSERADSTELIEDLTCPATPLATADRVGERSPYREEGEAPELARTPLERLEADVEIGADFRDYGDWKRDEKYPGKEFGWPTNKKRGRSRGSRPWEKMTAILLHTTGCGGMHRKRFLGVPAHMGVCTEATAVLMHPLNAYLYHAHTANKFSMGIEIAGESDITDAQIITARAVVRYCYEERQRMHEGPMVIMGHRMSHSSRSNDPGAKIWKEVGVWAMDTLQIKMGPVVGSGKTIPDSWL